MSKRVYISADYSENDGDRDVVDVLKKWGEDNQHKTDFVDTAAVKSGSVSDNADCRPCDLKKEFNKQINASSAVIFVVGDKTADRTAGSNCSRVKNPQDQCSCTPYKQNANGSTTCKVASTSPAGDDVGEINAYSYLKHEFEQAKKRNKTIIIVYNSLYKQANWLPDYMDGYDSVAHPFWIRNSWGEKVGDYQFIKEALRSHQREILIWCDGIWLEKNQLDPSIPFDDISNLGGCICSGCKRRRDKRKKIFT